MKSQYHNIWFINFSGIGNGIVIVPVLQCFEKSYPLAKYYHTENKILADQWFIKRAGLKNLKGFSLAEWRRFKQKNWKAIRLFIKEKNIDLIVNLRNEGPKYDIGYYQFKKETFKAKKSLDFWDLNFKTIERRIIHQNLTRDILVFLKMQNVDISSYNPNWLVTIRKNKNNFENIGFGLAASQINKRWPIIKWIDLAHKILKLSNQNIVLFPGKSKKEIEMATFIFNEINDKRCKIITGQSLKNIALQISKLRCFISNDSGLLHIAVAENVPTIGLYISTNFKIWSPYNGTDFIALQNTYIKKCPDPKPYCGNCFHYYDICPAIAKYGDDINSNKVYKNIDKLIDL